MSAPYPDMPHAQLDPSGLLPMHCFRAYLDGLTAGYAEGYAKGCADHADESWSLACEVVNGAAKSIDVMAARAKPYTIPRWAS